MTFTRLRRVDRDKGAASLETVGMIVLAALLVGAIVLAMMQNNAIGRAVSNAVCKILTLGNGTCDAGRSTAPDPHLPTEPCSTAAEGYEVSGEVAAGISGGSNSKVQIETLSNGQYAVTVTKGGSVGAEAGVGWDASVSVNGSGYGWDIGADAAARIQGGVETTYIVNTKEQAFQIRNWNIYQDAKNALVASNPATSIVAGLPFVGGAVDKIAEQLGGLQEPPAPDSTMVYGGVSADASAHDTLGVGQFKGSASIDAVIGVRTNSDGSYVVIGRASAGAVASASAMWKNASFDPNAGALVEASYDKTGTMTSVKFTGTTGLTRQDSTVESWNLPISSEADRQAANDLVYNVNPVTWKAFFDASGGHGQVTKLTYHDAGSDVGVKVGGKILADVGITGNLKLPRASVSSAQYWDGHRFVNWATCR
ncbi:hypothetical protein [Branchiibius sp. NY16-3462-2]|uniref:hypothetical protein n=1 Tax=Branchiibius sp. NY16-3462-2 TaxID=1807500 RepID=UPI00079933FE|nr:hypothetical protein [Branchiibius sp. NY16-3462-2]KYH45616.1 hypothetical protein AZH51_18015 [Branchiibius sp. NY16-3462-2]